MRVLKPVGTLILHYVFDRFIKEPSFPEINTEREKVHLQDHGAHIQP